MTRKPDLSALLPDEEAIRARRAALTNVLRPSARRGSRARMRVLVAVAALFVAGGGAAWAAGVFSADDVDPKAGVTCYDRPGWHNATIFSAAADPVEKCKRFWRQGVVRTGDTTPPPLVACTEENAGISVFPGGPATCERLGLVPLPSDYAPVGAARARAFAALFFLRGLMTKFPVPISECPSPRKQVEIARTRLADRYPDVRVAIEGDEPCGGGYDLATDHIAVVTLSEERSRANLEASKRRSARAKALGLTE